MTIFYPEYEKLLKLKVPLEAGELYLNELLKKRLDDTYEIFVQLFLHGDRPEFFIGYKLK